MAILIASVISVFQVFLVLLLVRRIGNSGVSLSITVFTYFTDGASQPFCAYIMDLNYFSIIEGNCVVSFPQGLTFFFLKKKVAAHILHRGAGNLIYVYSWPSSLTLQHG